MLNEAREKTSEANITVASEDSKGVHEEVRTLEKPATQGGFISNKAPVGKPATQGGFTSNKVMASLETGNARRNSTTPHAPRAIYGQ